MKNIFSFFSIVVLFSLILFSCSNELEGENETGELSELEFGDYPQVPTFEDRLMTGILSTNIGTIHNEGLDSVLAIGISNSTLTPYMYHFCLNRSFLTTSLSDSLDFWAESMAVIYDSLGMERSLNNALPMPNNIPSEWESYINRMEFIIDLGKDTITALEQFGIVKSNILHSETLSTTDKTCLLSIAEIAEASYHYNFVDPIITSSSSIAGKIAKSDLKGAAKSVLIGALTGKYAGLLVFGPGGVVTTVTTDAVVGGLRSSAWAAITSWF